MATGRGDDPTRDEEADAWLVALEAGTIDMHAFTRLIEAKIRRLKAQAWARQKTTNTTTGARDKNKAHINVNKRSSTRSTSLKAGG